MLSVALALRKSDPSTDCMAMWSANAACSLRTIPKPRNFICVWWENGITFPTYRHISSNRNLFQGEVPAFEPDLSFVRIEREQPASSDKIAMSVSPAPRLERELPKPWIRNFVSPFKLDIENMHENIKPEPRVRNFDMAAAASNSRLEPQNVSVYSISSNNGTICVTGHSPKSGKKSFILISKPALRLPKMNNDKYS